MIQVQRTKKGRNNIPSLQTVDKVLVKRALFFCFKRKKEMKKGAKYGIIEIRKGAEKNAEQKRK